MLDIDYDADLNEIEDPGQNPEETAILAQRIGCHSLGNMSNQDLWRLGVTLGAPGYTYENGVAGVPDPTMYDRWWESVDGGAR